MLRFTPFRKSLIAEILDGTVADEAAVLVTGVTIDSVRQDGLYLR
jgi:hypothetical protein